MIPISVLISKWFERRRGIALSICSAGSGLATIVLPPVIAALIQQFDLKTAFACENGFILVSAVVVYVVIRNSPVDVGLLPYSIPERAEKTARPTNRLRQDVSKSMLLWLLAIAFGTGITGTSSAFMTMLYTDCGYTETFAAMVFSVMGVVLTVGKFAIGSAMDRWGGFRALSIAYSAMITGLALHCLLFLRSSVLIAVSVSFFGLGMTITTVCISYLAEDFSTEESYGRILKYFQIAHTLALIIFGYVVGVVADLTQGYIAPFVMITCLTAISFAIVIRMYRWKQKNEAL